MRRKLEQVRGVARWMLVFQRLCQAFIVAAAIVVAAGWMDYVLRLPGWVRLVVGLAVTVVGVTWATRRLATATRFAPGLATLALRAEAVYPQLDGLLASAVEFDTSEIEVGAPSASGGFALALIGQLQQRLGGVALGRLIDPARTLRWTAAALLVLAALATLAIALPGELRGLAVRRWVLPLGDAQWPRRTLVESATHEAVWALDAPMLFEAAVRRGYQPGMRAALRYRVVGTGNGGATAGLWQEALLTEQTPQRNGRPGLSRASIKNDGSAGGDAVRTGRYQRLVDLREDWRGGAPRPGDVVEFRFAAGDDESQVRRMLLADRPAVTAVRARVEPPAYAAGLVSPQTLEMSGQSGPVSSLRAWAGSTVDIELRFNKPVPVRGADNDNDNDNDNGNGEETWRRIVPGLQGAMRATTPTWHGDVGSQNGADATLMDVLRLGMVLDSTTQSAVVLRDELGLESTSERVYRFEAMEDQLPGASLLKPAADESVLATAAVAIQAAAQDDVGLRRLALELVVPLPSAGGETGSATTTAATLSVAERRAAALTLDHELDLATLSVKPGDELTLTAVAQDVYEREGKRHEAVRSAARKLRIIDQATLIAQLRAELATLRQQAVRIEQTQRQVRDDTAQASDLAATRQSEIVRRMHTQDQVLGQVGRRMARNRLDEPRLQEVTQEAGRLLNQGEAAAEAAAAALRHDQPDEARTRQDQAAKAMQELAQLLDQGRDALTLQLQLRQMLTQQNALAGEVREALPRLAGRRAQDLSPAERAELEALRGRQAALAEQAAEMMRQMRAAAEALSRQSESDRDQAAAAALAEAARIAQQQALLPTMDQAAAATQKNQLSQAGNHQLDASGTMTQMLSELGSQERRRQEMLRRRLVKLVESIQRLLEQQVAQRDALVALDPTAAIAAMEPALLALRRQTMAVQTQAEQSPQPQAVAALLGQAAAAQGQAIRALRSADRPAATAAEREAVTHLEAALAQAQKQRDQAQRDQARERHAELEKAYRELAHRQRGLHDKTQPLAGLDRVTRAQRAALIDAGNEQADLQIAAAQLREQVEQTLVFLQSHRQIDQTTGRVVHQLRAGRADALLVSDQARVADLLVMMADALKQQQADEDFAGQEGGDGGGGGGGGGEPPVAPPLAELRLLRGMQESLLTQTRAAETSGDGGRGGEGGAMDGQQRRSRLMELSARQRELSDLAERLVEKLRPPAAGAAGGTGGGP